MHRASLLCGSLCELRGYLSRRKFSRIQGARMYKQHVEESCDELRFNAFAICYCEYTPCHKDCSDDTTRPYHLELSTFTLQSLRHVKEEIWWYHKQISCHNTMNYESQFYY